jgi:hypothetical protein
MLAIKRNCEETFMRLGYIFLHYYTFVRTYLKVVCAFSDQLFIILPSRSENKNTYHEIYCMYIVVLKHPVRKSIQ